jgi:asparagine synthase (glutamine-hydrolysing)
MASALAHRGPDGQGVWLDESAGVAFGHRRLSIVDLSEAGAQPTLSHSARWVITFNGEIYNHQDIRRELAARASGPPPWRGSSDTETLIEAIDAWGVEDAVKRCVGMFALAAWDRQERELTLVRDRFGEKPLYYGWLGSGADACFAFASELKALKAHPGFDNAIDPESVDQFLRYCYVPAPASIYQGIFKLSPGEIGVLKAPESTQRQVRTQAYWRFKDVALAGAARPFASDAEADEALEEALAEAVRLQLVADVPVGAFLSGGIDSTSIVALGQRHSTRAIKTFTVGFEGAGLNEAPYAEAIARHLGTDHETIDVSAQSCLDVVPLLPRMYDEPFADNSQIPTHIVSRVARRFVTVALSGDGGDELFGGYNRYFWAPAFWKAVGRTPKALRHAAGQFLAAAPIQALNLLGQDMSGTKPMGDSVHRMAERLRSVQDIDSLYFSMVAQWPKASTPARLPAARPAPIETLDLRASGLEAEHRMMVYDTLSYLPDDILAKVDRAAMATSLETRVPMLDHRVAAIAWRMPLSSKMNRKTGKLPLRRLLDKYVPSTLLERPKAGFGIAVGEWLRGPLRSWADDLLQDVIAKEHPFLRSAPIKKLWSEHLSGDRDWSTRLWNVLMLLAWLREAR